MSHITTINEGILKGHVIKISQLPFMVVVDKQEANYNKLVTSSRSRLIMAEDTGPIFQQLGQLQGQMTSMVSAQHQQLKQASELNVTMRVEIEKVYNSISSHKDVLEKRQDRLELKLENLKVKVSMIAAGVAIGVNIAVQLAFKLWQ